MHLVVLRFSAIGDVALTIPVLLAVQKKYPTTRITVVSRPFFKSLFTDLGFDFLPADFSKKHKGFKGNLVLAKEILEKLEPTHIIDLHQVLRTAIIRNYLRLKEIKTFKIDKGRHDKKRLTRKKDKLRNTLLHSCERYANVFAKAGFEIDFNPQSPILPKYQNSEAEKLSRELSAQKVQIGIAPLATHAGKIWPKEKVKQLIGHLIKQNFGVVLFGGPSDIEQLNKLKEENSNVTILAGRFNFSGEIAFMRHLEAMVSMDSSNMHLASLAGIPVVSIWGATHWQTGFYALGKNENLRTEIPETELDCRPCSVFGNKPCFRGDYACMQNISSNMAWKKISLAIKSSNHEA